MQDFTPSGYVAACLDSCALIVGMVYLPALFSPAWRTTFANTPPESHGNSPIVNWAAGSLLQQGLHSFITGFHQEWWFTLSS